MEKIEPGKYVELGYDLYAIDADGKETLIHQTTDEEPEAIIYGVTQGVIRPLEVALEGLTPGDTYDVVAKADEAFGRHNPEHVVEVEREVFEVDGKFDSEHIKVGERLPMLTADGYRIEGLVTEITPTHVRMDFNHPLVDHDVRLKGKVIVVRDATPEELHPAHGCGCHGGCGEGCGDDCGCDDNCGCDDSGCGCGCR